MTFLSDAAKTSSLPRLGQKDANPTAQAYADTSTPNLGGKPPNLLACRSLESRHNTGERRQVFQEDYWELWEAS